MIDSIRLINFMSHKDTTVKLDSFTAITGLNDHGKSAVLHAVRWFMTGEPKGSNLIMQGKKEASVHITINGLTHSKHRTKTKTFYNSGDIYYEKSELPDDIKTAINFDITQFFGKNEFNLFFNSQLDRPFLLAESSAMGADVLGGIADTSSLDGAAAQTSKSRYKLNNDINETKATIKVLIDQLKDYEIVDMYTGVLKKAKSEYNRLKALEEKQIDLSESSKEYQELSKSLQDVVSKLESLSNVVLWELDIKQDSKKLGIMAQLIDIHNEVEFLETDINNLSKKLSLVDLDYEKVHSEVSKLEDDVDAYNTLKFKRDEYIADDLIRTRCFSDIKKYPQKVEKELQEILKDSANLSKLFDLNKIQTSIKTTYDRLERKIAETDVDDSITTKDLSMLMKNLFELNKLFTEAHSIKNVINKWSKDHANQDALVKELSEELAKLWSELKICPLCKTKIK